MKIVIDIPDGYVGVIMSNQRMEGSAMDKLIRQAVINGTPLPKAHGDLVDRTAILDEMALTPVAERNFNSCVECVECVPTIISADNEVD